MPKVLMFLLVLAGLFIVMFPPDTTVVKGVLNCKAPKDDKIICTLTEE
jgi:hypothetical protein